MRSLWSPRSLGLKLGLVLFLIVAGAMALVYFAIVPRLENRLVDTTYDSLERSVPTVAVGLNSNPRFEYPQVADFFQDRLNARVAVFERLTDDTLVLVADSYEAPAELAGDPILLESARTGSPVRGRTERDGREFAVLAAPAPDRPGTYVLLAAPLADRLSAINVVRRDLLIFGGIALAASWLVGALAAGRHTRRIRRLESAAERIAAGDLEAPIVAEGNDEVAELARGPRSHARSARAPRPGAPGVHRQRLARAQDAAVRARRLPRAAGGRGPRRGDATGLPGDGTRAGGPPHEARNRSARPLEAGCGQARVRLGAGRPGRHHDVARGGVRPACGGDGSRAQRRGRRGRRRPRRRGARAANRSRARRERASPHARRYDGGAARVDLGRSARNSPCTTTAQGSPRQIRSRCSSASIAATGRRPRAAASAWRSRGSLPSAWVGRSSCARSQARRRSPSRWPEPPSQRFHVKTSWCSSREQRAAAAYRPDRGACRARGRRRWRRGCSGSARRQAGSARARR